LSLDHGTTLTRGYARSFREPWPNVHDCEQTKALHDLVPDRSKCAALQFRITRNQEGILKLPVNGLYSGQTMPLARSSLVEGNHEIEYLIADLLNRPGSLLTHVETDFPHNLDRKSMNRLGRNASAESLEIQGIHETQQGFRDGAMKTIRGTQEKDALLQNSASYSVGAVSLAQEGRGVSTADVNSSGMTGTFLSGR
jgi:hypothetical protein